jgi:hypothetical protein
MRMEDKPVKRFLKLAAVSALSFVLAFGVASLGIAPRRLEAQVGPSGANPVIQPTQRLTPLVFTATSQTVTRTLPSSSCAVISQTANTLTTATFTVEVSNDGGTTYYPAAVAPYVGSAARASVLTAITVTTSGHLYILPVVGMTNLEAITSSTFTGTSLTLTITTTGNPCPGGV